MTVTFERMAAETDERSIQDEALVAKILAGEPDLFREIIARHERLVTGIVARRARPAMVREIAHDVFVRAYRSLPTYRGERPLSHWLARIAVRECYDRWRCEFRNREDLAPRTSPDELAWLERAAAVTAVQNSEMEENRRIALDLFHRALEQLSPEDRAVLVLIHVEERPVAEAAELLGWSSVNVKVRAHRARHRLRAAIEALEQQSGGTER